MIPFLSLAARCIRAPVLDSSQRLSWFSVLGISILYSSAYFLPPLTPTRAYLLPSHDLFRLIVLPSLIGTAVVSLLIYVVALLCRGWVAPRLNGIVAVLALSIMALIALKGLMEAAGYEWQDQIPVRRDLLSAQQHFKIAAAAVVLVVAWTFRKFLRQQLRLLSSLGFALGLTAVVRLFILYNAHTGEAGPAPAASTSISGPVTTSRDRPRRVVWVIFDELDYGRALADDASRPKLENFNRLADHAFVAANANSPASATLYSIPSLVTGIPIGSQGIKIDKSASLRIDTGQGGSTRFDEASSIFGELALSGRSASVLGFYHPYCKLFALQRCSSFSYYEVGALDSALWSNVPDRISGALGRTDLMQDITQASLQLLPEYLARDDVLTYIHLNVPHLPALYAAKVLNLPPTPDPLIQYSRNLIVMDQILGSIVRQVQQQTVSHELLLVVSSDHWLRNIWYQADIPEAVRPIPFFVWKIGETAAVRLTKQVSTVHTAAMILDYLDGKLTTQAEIAQWWTDQTVVPTYIVPRT